MNTKLNYIQIEGRDFDTLAAAVASPLLFDGATVNIAERTTGNGGGAVWDVVLASTVTTNSSHIIQCTGVITLALVLRVQNKAYLNEFGALGDGATVNSTIISEWLDYLIDNDIEGYVPSGIFLTDYITKATTNGIKIVGQGTIRATGSARLNHIRFTDVRGKVELAGVTFDGNDICARPLEIQNTGGGSAGDVWIRPTCKIINAKNTSPDTYTVAALRVHGWFNDVIFEGEIDGADSTSTTGAATIGLWTSWTGAGDDWVRRTVVTSKAKIKNVKNDNITLADADGIQATAPPHKWHTFPLMREPILRTVKDVQLNLRYKEIISLGR